MAEIEKTGKLTAGSRADLGRVGIGVVIREGAPAPDFSTPEAFQQDAARRQIGRLHRAGAGRHVGRAPARLLKKLGIADVITKKAVHAKGGIDISQKVARGEAEIGVTLISEIVPVKGARMAGAAAGSAAAVDRLHVGDPGKQHAARRGARLRQCADLAGDGGALDGGRLPAAAIGLIQRASSSRSDCSSWRASSALIGSPNTIALRVFAAELIELDRVGIRSPRPPPPPPCRDRAPSR